MRFGPQVNWPCTGPHLARTVCPSSEKEHGSPHDRSAQAATFACIKVCFRKALAAAEPWSFPAYAADASSINANQAIAEVLDLNGVPL